MVQRTRESGNTSGGKPNAVVLRARNYSTKYLRQRFEQHRALTVRTLVHLGTRSDHVPDDGYREVFVEIEGGRTRWDLISEFHDDGEGGAHLGRYSDFN